MRPCLLESSCYLIGTLLKVLQLIKFLFLIASYLLKFPSLTYKLSNCLFFVVSAIINRCGFNSEGIFAVAKRLGVQHGKRKLAETSSTSSSSNDEVKQGGKAGPGILGVNIGKNKTSEDAAADYVQGVHSLSQYADYLVKFLFSLVHFNSYVRISIGQQR